MRQLLILFLKYPEKGRVKTRLAESIGDNQALQLYKYLVNQSISQANQGAWDLQLHWAQGLTGYPGYEQFQYSVQHGADLGQRMHNSIKSGLESYDQVLLVGSDIAGISAETFGKAFKALNNYDLVLGPANDGGYYLIGMKEAYPELFNLKEWSHSLVLNQTLEKSRGLNLSHLLVETLTDIDTIDDLKAHPELLKMIDG